MSTVSSVASKRRCLSSSAARQRLPSQRTDIVLVLSLPIDFPRRQRGSVDTAHTDDVPQLLAKRREAVANPMRCRCALKFSGRVRRTIPLIFGNCAHEIGGQGSRSSTLLYCTKSSIDIA